MQATSILTYVGTLAYSGTLLFQSPMNQEMFHPCNYDTLRCQGSLYIRISACIVLFYDSNNYTYLSVGEELPASSAIVLELVENRSTTNFCIALNIHKMKLITFIKVVQTTLLPSLLGEDLWKINIRVEQNASQKIKRTLSILTITTPVGTSLSSTIDFKSISDVSSWRGYSLLREKLSGDALTIYIKVCQKVHARICTSLLNSNMYVRHTYII